MRSFRKVFAGHSKWQIWIIFLLFSGTLINAIDRGSISTANTFIAGDLHMSKAAMGVILSAFGWTYLLFNLPAGYLCDRLGAKRVYGAAAAIWSLGSMLTGFARTPVTLLFSRLIVGAGEAANFPAATKVVTENFRPERRGTATGVYLSGLRLGYALTPGIMLGLMVWFGSRADPDWHIAFVVTGLASLAWVALWMFSFRERRPATREDVLAKSGGGVRLRLLLQRRNTWAIVFIKFFQDYVYYLYLTWLPGYLIEARHMNLGSVAFYATMPWIAGVLAQPLVGMLSDRLIGRGYNLNRVKKSILVVSQLVAISVVGAAFAHSATTAAWLLVLAMAAESASTAILWSVPQDLAPGGAAGSLGGIMNTAGALASIVAPALTGVVAEYFGFAAALSLCGVTMLGAILCVVFFLTPIRQMRLVQDERAAEVVNQ
ncbi:MFS transporter [Rubrobacter calidifluminis]|uniref:MFS transporter n=1 Tax=Rubrobacter calidifluminis TaxID=1392640 RepID=UPI00236179B9|nr:MFS transporter [Rubrobacter calidifluminis]